MARSSTKDGQGPTLVAGSSRVDPRLRGAWQAWLSSLATDSEAATAAAHLYGELPMEARDAWLDALVEDLPDLAVPPVAVYGPLLAVEDDADRRARICQAAGAVLGPITSVDRALFGTASGGVRMAALVIPLYLDFVRLLVCRFVKDRGFDWVRQDPFVIVTEAPAGGSEIDGVELFVSSTEAVVDELAHAVLAHRRTGRTLPKLLCDCSDLFTARLPCA
ncbi:MAG: hypothetical protein JRI68_08185 [Deltaproteobacteria bacterium]|nr:hypothetical protein [Deltaproteobacteria bacterium]